MKKKYKEGALFLFLTYPLGICAIFFFLILIISGRIEVIHGERLPRWKGNMIIASNHPSLWEVVWLPLLLWWKSWLRPSYFPWSTPDKSNYYDKWYWYVFRSRFIPVPRGDKRGEFAALKKMISVLKDEGIIILFPEGGRTCKGELLFDSPKGKGKMREIRNGIGSIIKETNAKVVPVWVSGANEVLPLGSVFPRFWRRTVITVGEPMEDISESIPNKKELSSGVASRVFENMLQLADEG